MSTTGSLKGTLGLTVDHRPVGEQDFYSEVCHPPPPPPLPLPLPTLPTECQTKIVIPIDEGDSCAADEL